MAESTTTQKSGAEKSAQSNAKATQDVIESDPTETGRTDDLLTAGVREGSVLIKADGTVSGDLYTQADDTDPFMVVGADIVQEFFYPNTKRPAHRVLFTKGQTVRKSAIDALSAKADAAKLAKENPLAAHIDSTTYASGTGADTAL